MVRLLRFVLYFLIVLLAISSIFIIFLDYELFCVYLVKLIGRPDKLDILQTVYFPAQNFSLFRIFFLCFSVVGSFGILFLIKHLEGVFYRVGSFFCSVVVFLKHLKCLGRLDFLYLMIIFGLLFVYKLYCLLFFPISYDEAVTFLNFTSNGPLVSLSYYPAPNNHILYSLFTNFFYIISGNSILSLRLPSLIIWSISFFVLFIILHKLFNFNNALIGISFYSVLYPILLYSGQGRGYMLYVFFAIVGFYSVYKILTSCDKNRYYAFWALSMIGGLFTIPSFLYVLLVLGAYLLVIFIYNKHYREVYNLFIWGFIIGLITTLLYLPTIIISGYESLFANKYVLIKDRGEIISSLWGLANTYYSYFFYFCYSNIGLLLIAGICLFLFACLFCKNNDKVHLQILTLAFLLSPIFILPLHSVIPFARNWAYLGVFISFGIVFIINRLENYMPLPKLFVLVISLGLVFYGIYSFDGKYKQDFAQDYFAEDLTMFLINKKAHNLYFNTEYEEVIACYNYRVLGMDYNVCRGHIDCDFDLLGNYDAVILSKDTLANVDTTYYLSSKNEHFTLYFKSK